MFLLWIILNDGEIHRINPYISILIRIKLIL